MSSTSINSTNKCNKIYILYTYNYINVYKQTFLQITLSVYFFSNKMDIYRVKWMLPNLCSARYSCCM